MGFLLARVFSSVDSRADVSKSPSEQMDWAGRRTVDA